MTLPNALIQEYLAISPATIHEYYGTVARFSNDAYQFILMNGIYGNAIGFSEFLTADDAAVYNAYYLGMKHLIRDLRHAWQESNEPLEAFKDVLLAQWIPLSNHFIVRYSKELVPHDIRFAINDVCRNVDLQTLTWPPILVVNGDGSVTDSDEVDEYGRTTSMLS